MPYRTIRSSALTGTLLSPQSERDNSSGARSFLPTTSRKATMTAMEEVRRGLVKYSDATQEAALEAALMEENA